MLGADRAYYVRFEIGSCTISNASPAVITKAGHGLVDDDPVVFRTSGALPTGLTPGVIYYVNYVDVDTFQVALTPDGASINTSSAGSGTHYISSGSDSNDGLSTGLAGSLLTLAKAIDLAAALDTSIYNVTIQLADTHIVSGHTFKGAVGAGRITVQGNSGTPSNVLIQGANSCNQSTTPYTLKDVKLTLTSGSTSACIRATQNAAVIIDNIDFGSSVGYHIRADNGGTVTISSPIAITGGARAHYLVVDTGIIVGTGLTVTMTGTLNFSVAFAVANRAGVMNVSSNTYTGGTITGTRYDAKMNGVIDTTGGGANYFPGDAAGTTATGGQYA
jgi:hypothetical protein